MTYTVRIVRTPYVFEVAADETLLQAALRHNIPMPWGCGEGVCGTCLVQVLSGTLIYPHQPLALFEEDSVRGKGLACVGLARSDVVLEVPELSD